MQDVRDSDQALREQLGFVDWELNNTEKGQGISFEPRARDVALRRLFLDTMKGQPIGSAIWPRVEILLNPCINISPIAK
ncbi:hypothetical protein [Acetobacter pasteurianus]|uniref:hypothetical protein n=1 Tax=Acetobacter pasteurianus TaxID=438 RepID=UPI00216B02E5|nr:hypothetical protein [Acetobacter pasteurianus]